jgi:hypothetical protein
MKFRRLKAEELDSLEEDFIQFLASNTVTADDWKSMQNNDPEKADEMIDVFSDVVWEKILGNIKFMQHRFPQELRVYKFDENEASAIVLRFKSDGIDLTDNDDVQGIASGKIDLTKFSPEVLHGTRPYRSNRKQEIFVLMEQGAKPCKEAFWLSIAKMLN